MQENQPTPSRRGFFFGAAATGAAAAAVMALPGLPAAEVSVAPPKPAPEKGGGYSASAHVERYYKTARV
ncbi:MAG: Twin-arginine translocation pathway signal [Polaromonas sp.]|nr:Twin-arginine translocation pathway signal [Polaromonas sp.]